jgi:hypothetical protein
VYENISSHCLFLFIDLPVMRIRALECGWNQTAYEAIIEEALD